MKTQIPFGNDKQNARKGKQSAGNANKVPAVPLEQERFCGANERRPKTTKIALRLRIVFR
jgi:hypothetical protein